jgi:hypothetical protein
LGSGVAAGSQGGIGLLGNNVVSHSDTANIDSDGDPTAQSWDATWQAQTSGGYNAATTPFVVATSQEQSQQGVQMGDWATVTNNATGQTTWARVGDSGNPNEYGEISEAAATAVEISYTAQGTVGNPSVTVHIIPARRIIQTWAPRPFRNMKHILLLILLLVPGRYCQAAKQVDSPDGAWTLKQMPLKTLTGDATQGIGVFATSGGEAAATIPVKTLNCVTGITIRWSPDSRKVAVVERFPRGTLITAAWFDGEKWYSTIQEDRDLDTLLAKAEEIGSKKHGYKTETADLGKWVYSDTIEVNGVLGYLGYRDVSYSYHIEIVPGSYPVSGGYEVGALKYSDYHVESVPAGETSKRAGSTSCVFGQPCALIGRLERSGQSAWVLKLNEPVAVASNDPNVQGVSGVTEVTLLGISTRGAAYLARIAGRSIKVSGSPKPLTTVPEDANAVEFVLSDDAVKALEEK